MPEGMQVKIERKRLFESYFSIQEESDDIMRKLLQKDWENEMAYHRQIFSSYYEGS